MANGEGMNDGRNRILFVVVILILAAIGLYVLFSFLNTQSTSSNAATTPKAPKALSGVTGGEVANIEAAKLVRGQDRRENYNKHKRLVSQ